MEYMEWNYQEYSVNIEMVDEQHKELIGYLNELHDAYDKGEDNAIIETLLDKLKGYARYHFELEERLLESNDYPGYMEHRGKHQFFIGHIVDLEIDYMAGKKDVTERTMHLLKDWIDRHIKVADKEYTEYLHDKNIF